MCFEGGLLFVRPDVPLSSPSAIVKGLGASFLVNAEVLVEKSETVYFMIVVDFPPVPL